MINFPSSPALNDTHTVGPVTYQWDGVKWVVKNNHTHVPADVGLSNVLNVAQVNKAGDTMTGNLVVPSLNGGQLAGLRNKIINGKMEIAQRGTSFPAIVSGAYSLDRWMNVNLSSSVATISQQADAPSTNEYQSSLRYAVTTADTDIAAGDVTAILHRIEGYNALDLIGRTFTLSFWVRSSKTGVHCVTFLNGGANRAYVAEYTVNAANTWEFKSVTVSGGLIASGTWYWDNRTGLTVGFTLAAGSTFRTTAGAWQTGNLYATANQVNCLDTIGNIFAITGVQLEVGSVATPFEHRPIGLELALCQRYYFRAGPNSVTAISAVGQAFSATTCGCLLRFPVSMRAKPAALEQSGSATDYQVFSASGAAIPLSAAPSYNAATTTETAWVSLSVASGLVAGNAVCLSYFNNNAYLGWSAEL